ncbi:hypothetical protein EDD85DRAFT_787975 [Armillaria nabsnona]|nr:hypothetical protein EDD85DRAFT_787975 [Armillaria nabsnona]
MGTLGIKSGSVNLDIWEDAENRPSGNDNSGSDGSLMGNLLKPRRDKKQDLWSCTQSPRVGGSSDETSKRQRNAGDILHDDLQSLKMKSSVKSKNGNPCSVCSTFRIQDREEDWGILYSLFVLLDNEESRELSLDKAAGEIKDCGSEIFGNRVSFLRSPLPMPDGLCLYPSHPGFQSVLDRVPIMCLALALELASTCGLAIDRREDPECVVYSALFPVDLQPKFSQLKNPTIKTMIMQTISSLWIEASRRAQTWLREIVRTCREKFGDQKYGFLATYIGLKQRIILLGALDLGTKFCSKTTYRRPASMLFFSGIQANIGLPGLVVHVTDDLMRFFNLQTLRSNDVTPVLRTQAHHYDISAQFFGVNTLGTNSQNVDAVGQKCVYAKRTLYEGSRAKQQEEKMRIQQNGTLRGQNTMVKCHFGGFLDFAVNQDSSRVKRCEENLDF